jgi:ATP-dependent protease ClpP protease subunit
MIKVMARGQKSAEVLIYDPIGADWFGNGVTAKRFRDDLEAMGDVAEITVRINSPGGEVFDGLTIYNTLKEHPAKVTVHVDGLAASIASVIAMAGDRIVMGEGAMFMVHSPWTVAMGNADNMRATADMLDKVEVGLVDAYVSRTGKARAAVQKWMEGETWFTRDEAIAAGLATEIAAITADQGEPLAFGPLKVAAQQQFRAFAAVMQERTQIPAIVPDKSESAGADEETTMTVENKSSVPNTDIEAARQAGIAAERARVNEIKARFGRFADSHRALLDACVEDPACTAEAASTKLLAKLGEGSEPLAPRVAITRDSRDAFLEGAGKALEARVGLGAREIGNEYNGKDLSAIAEKALNIAGISTTGLTRDGVARKVLAVHTSSDFPNLLSVTAGKVLRQAYDNFPDTWSTFAAAGSVSDFKVHPRIQLGSFGNLATIPEGSEYTYGTTAENYENASAVTKGRAIALTRQMIVNDDLGGFNRRAAIMGRSAKRTVNTDVYAFLTSGASNRGPTSIDTGQYFNATAATTAGGHANLTATGTAISVASLGVGRTLMRRQRDNTNTETLNIQPAVLVVPVGKEDLARELLASTTDFSSANANKPNIYRNAFTVVSDPYLDGISATAWYLFANPADVAAFEVVFLDGNQTPFVDDMIDFDTDAMKFKIRLDYGVAIGDWRGGYKNEGA